MSRLFSALSIILLLVSFAQPVSAYNTTPENPSPGSVPGYQLNSEGDEWVWVDPDQPEPRPPAPPETAPGSDQELSTAALPPAASAQEGARAEAALGIALDRARQAGPQAVLAFVAGQPDPSTSLLQAARLDAQLDLSALTPAQPAAPTVPLVSLNSGPCAFDTIQAAVDSSVDGDTVRVSAGVYMETVDVTGNAITIQGGYDATCTTFTGGLTEISANAPGSVVDVTGASSLSLRNLSLTGGTSFGARLDVLGSSRVTLDSTDVHDNNGSSGTGIYVGGGSVVTYTNDSDIYNNTSSGTGGGAIVYGTVYGFDTTSDVYNNSAVNGAGFAVLAGSLVLDNSDVTANQATGLGGGIYVVSQGEITLTNSVFVGETSPCCQQAAEGGGIYADNSQVALLGSTTSVINNTASGNGGGIYLTNGADLTVTGGSLGYDSSSSAGNDAVLGAGLYAINSTVSFSGRIVNNIATNSGGGIYADQSTLALDDVTVGGIAPNQHNQIGPTGLNGAGLYLTNLTQATIDHSIIVSNTLSNPGTGYGGGMYVRANSTVTMTSSSIQEHFLPSPADGRGAAMYLYDATVTLSNTQVLSNTTNNLGGGARMFSVSTLNVLGGSTFRNNHALGGIAGAIAATNAPVIQVSDAAFLSNTSSSHGGAIYMDGGTLAFTGSWDLRSNQAGGNGGAVALVGTSDASFSATGGPSASYLAYNHANGSGGAVYTTNNRPVELYATSGYRIYLLTNSAGGDGGALYADNGAFFDIYGDVHAIGNAAGGNGGMAYLGGGSKLWLDDYFNLPPEVHANEAANGGAIYASNSPRVECDGAIFGSNSSGNTAISGSGGALYLSGSSLTADNCTFSDNQAQAGDGGAIAAYTSTLMIDVDYPFASKAASRDAPQAGPQAPQATACDPHARQCSSLQMNTASGDGGALYASSSSLIVNSSYLVHNTAQRGGAIYQEGAGASGVISNTLVYSNTSLLAFGAGIRAAAGEVTIRQATLADNSGGAGYSPGAVQSYIYNTIIWGNSSAAFGALTDVVCNIDQGGTAGPAQDPLFIAPGAGENYRLQYGSPAIDACAAGLPLDLLNTPRPQHGQFDMGAFEMPGPAYLEIAHLAPFTMGPGMPVTVTQDGVPLVSNYNFADSTGYLMIPSGSSLVEVWPAGAGSPAISATVNISADSENTLIAAGDGSNQPLALVALVDNPLAPAPGKFLLRVGHLAAFASGSALVDLRLQDGTLLLGAIAYGDVSVFLPLDAGTYDLKFTTPGGGSILIDPLPVTFAAGDIISIFAVGDDANQPLGVFAWEADTPGELLPLADFRIYLPVLRRD